jgi:hypothetical protein
LPVKCGGGVIGGHGTGGRANEKQVAVGTDVDTPLGPGVVHGCELENHGGGLVAGRKLLARRTGCG